MHPESGIFAPVFEAAPGNLESATATSIPALPREDSDGSDDILEAWTRRVRALIADGNHGI